MMRDVTIARDNRPAMRDGFRRFRPLLAFFLAICLAAPALAGTTGKIAGVVKEKDSGEPLIGANIYIDGYPFGAATDLDGYYYILNVPPGTYTLVAQMIGYQEVRMTNVRVNVDLTTKINLDLGTETVEGAEVVVTADRPLINKDLTSTSVNITADEIKALPVDDFNEVVNLQAGVVAGHFRGGRDGEVLYMLDGIPVNDPFNNSLGIEVENSSIQQLEVISGTFNAEYGQALSGVVNIVTKEGGGRYEADVNLYAGNYVTDHDQIFPNLDRIDGEGTQSLQFSLSGPVPFLKNLKFFATARSEDNQGYYFGPRLYAPSDNNPFLPSGDSSFVPLSEGTQYSLHGKLTYYLTPAIKLNYGYLWDDNENRYYSHGFRLVPDAPKTHFRTNSNQNFQVNHGVSKSTFYTLKFAYNVSDYKGYVYKNPFDIRYLDSDNGQPASGYTFRSGGNESDRYARTSTTMLGRWDINSQVTKLHKIGAGIQYQKHKLENFYTDLDIENSSVSQGIQYPGDFTPGQEKYLKEPIEISAYIQDKIEFEDFIINAGLRFDYFDPRTDMPSDVRNPELISFFNTDLSSASVKSQISPRLGVAFPITTQGVIHVSYGHFFQMPNFELLYQGITDSAGVSQYYLPRDARLNSIRGNPDLEAQRTVMYEIGLQQALNSQLAIEFTAYFRDIRNLVGTEIIETYDTKQYARYVNRDYGNVRGVILSFEKRFADHWGARLDYTYQLAEGNASDPRSVFYDNQTQPPRESEKKLIPLDWDQRNTLNISINTGTPGNWNVGVIGRVGTGTPYTAASRFLLGEITFRNNRTKPSTLSFDLKADKSFRIGRTRITAFLWAENLLDRLNEYSVYSSTGRANNDLEAQLSAGEIIGLHTLDDYILNPGYYSAPRQIRLGLSAGF
ncbi:MAG: TonB-dependent receptor [Calditrichaeota bacterium]|nr:TonB-dependent receptor [Calditrichota bacterium]